MSLLPGSVVTGKPTAVEQAGQMVLGQIHEPQAVISYPPHHRCALRRQDGTEKRLALLLSTQASHPEMCEKDWQQLRRLGFVASLRGDKGGDHSQVDFEKQQHSHGNYQEVGPGEGPCLNSARKDTNPVQSHSDGGRDRSVVSKLARSCVECARRQDKLASKGSAEGVDASWRTCSVLQG